MCQLLRGAFLLCWTVALAPEDVVKVPDGDTVHAWVRVWDSARVLEKFRVKDINTPEMKSPTLEAARAAQGFTQGWLREGDARVLFCGVRDKYGRAVAVFSRQGDDLATALRQAGHGR